VVVWRRIESMPAPPEMRAECVAMLRRLRKKFPSMSFGALRALVSDVLGDPELEREL
jgi:hypothetical protein